ncbi:MAG: nucleoside hydrolase [Methylobacteriaceae bacterium]|nr:nucleoside hydrolase [Methylobacteriaceae bacterium]MBV9636675.1 nucleoside hydrolase [Methylobacteriaceae bacterium]MBV9702517.1 nucleoside hydrolase [Methylobacteriaceae bacterium]
MTAKHRIMTIAATCMLAAGLPAAAPARADEPRLVIADNDYTGPGGTDLQSILLFLDAPDIRLLGVTVVTGDQWEKEEVQRALRFLEIANVKDVPVVPGAEVPLINTKARLNAWERTYGRLPWKGAWNDPKPGSSSVHGPDDIPPFEEGAPTTQPSPQRAADFLIEQVHKYPHQVSIYEGGPMTNLALAVRLDPQFASLAKELVFMGGIIDANLLQVTVNADNYTDFNLLFDPEAAHIVLTAPWAKITSVGNVTNDAVMTPDLLNEIAKKKSPLTDYIVKYAWKNVPLWDEMAAAVLVDPSLVTKETTALMDVDLARGVDYGRIHVWPQEYAPKLDERPVNIVEKVDVERFLKLFVRAAQFEPRQQ